MSVLQRIVEHDGSDMHGDVDEWSEAAAFAKVQEIARAALAEDTGD